MYIFTVACSVYFKMCRNTLWITNKIIVLTQYDCFPWGLSYFSDSNLNNDWTENIIVYVSTFRSSAVTYNEILKFINLLYSLRGYSHRMRDCDTTDLLIILRIFDIEKHQRSRFTDWTIFGSWLPLNLLHSSLDILIV